MKRTMLLVALAGIIAAAPAARTAPPALPKPSFEYDGALQGLAAAGWRVAAADYCEIRTARLAAGAKVTVRRVRRRGLPCETEGSDESGDYIVDLWLGRNAFVAQFTCCSTSVHTSGSALWKGPLPSGPAEELTSLIKNHDTETEQGCEGHVVAGGGVIAWKKLRGEERCDSRDTTTINLIGAARARTTVDGSWWPLATDGKRLVLEHDGALSVVALDGKRLAAPRVRPAVAKDAISGWLAREGLVLVVLRKSGKDLVWDIAGPGWRLRNVNPWQATVGYGRLLYLTRNALRVRRIRDGADRPLLTLPKRGEKYLAAGSFGLAIGIETQNDSEEYHTSVHRIGWRVIDAALPAN